MEGMRILHRWWLSLDFVLLDTRGSPSRMGRLPSRLVLGAGVARVGGVAVASLQYTFYLFIAWSTNSTSQPLPLSSCYCKTCQNKKKRFRPQQHCCAAALPCQITSNLKRKIRTKNRNPRNSNRCPLLALESVLDVLICPLKSSCSLQMLDSPHWQTMYNSKPLT